MQIQGTWKSQIWPWLETELGRVREVRYNAECLFRGSLSGFLVTIVVLLSPAHILLILILLLLPLAQIKDHTMDSF